MKREEQRTKEKRGWGQKPNTPSGEHRTQKKRNRLFIRKELTQETEGTTRVVR